MTLCCLIPCRVTYLSGTLAQHKHCLGRMSFPSFSIFAIKIYVFIQKTTTFISVGVDITFFFFSLKSHKAFKLVLLVAGGRAIANRPGSCACISALTLVTWKWLQGLGLFDPFRYPMCSPVIMSARAAKVQHYVTLHVGMHTGSTRGLTVHLQRVWRSPWCDILPHSSSEIPGKLFCEYRGECCSLFSHLLHGALVLFESQIAC